MPLITTRNVGAEITAASLRTPYHGVTIERGLIEVRIADDAGITEAYRAYPGLREEMKRNADKAIDERVDLLTKDLERFLVGLDEESLQPAKQQELIKVAEKTIKHYVEGMERLTAAVLEGTWKDFTKTRQDYARYAVKVTFRTAFGGIKLANSFRGLLGGFLCPVIGVIAVYSTLKSTIVYVKDVRMLCKQAETVQEEFLATYEKVHKVYVDHCKKAVGLREAGAKLANTLLPVEPASIAKLEKLCELTQRKFDGLKVRSYAYQKQLNEASTKYEKVVADLAKGNAIIERGVPKVAKNREKLFKLMADLEQKAADLRRAINHLQNDVLPPFFRRIDLLHESIPHHTAAVRDLKARVPKWSSALQKWVIPFADLVFADTGENLAGKVAVIAGDLATQSQTFEKIMMGIIEKVV